MMDWKGIPSSGLTDYEVARIGYNNTVHGLPPTAEEVHNMACALQASQARLSEAVKVLEPFAEAAECLDGNDDYSSAPIWEHAAAMNITVGDLRRVKRFLATLGEET